jgi:hypothetical protein
VRTPNPEIPEDDTTLEMLEAVHDGSLAGLAGYHLLRRQLRAIRALPERDDHDRRPRIGPTDRRPRIGPTDRRPRIDP